MDALVEDLGNEEPKIFFAEVLRGVRGNASRCTGCKCMWDPELRESKENDNANNENLIVSGDQNPTAWPRAEETFISKNANNNSGGKPGVGLHTDAADARCHLVVKNHKTANDCVGLQHGAEHHKQRYVLESSNQVMRDKCNEVLKRIWCEQQAHGLTNLCYFISETEKICFDALGVPCDQIYGWIKREPKSSFTHAWVKLGEKKQLIDITFYKEKAGGFPNHYWLELDEYQLGAGPNYMAVDTQFKKHHHWKYVYLCTLVEIRRDFLRCVFKFMIDQMQVRIPDVFKDASSSCWNCQKHLASSPVITCPDCQSAVFCSEKCRALEREEKVSHLEVCADYVKREKSKQLTLKKPAVTSLEALMKGK